MIIYATDDYDSKKDAITSASIGDIVKIVDRNEKRLVDRLNSEINRWNAMHMVFSDRGW